MPSLRQIRYFIAAAESNKINAASASLGISQSSVTTAIQQLEAELGVALFTRKASGISLTIEGARFLNHARSIEATVSDAVRSMRNGINRIKGQLRVGLTYAVSGYFILPLLARFRRAFPELSVKILEEPRPELERLLKEDSIDVALMIVSNVEDRTRIAQKPMLRSRRRLWLPSGHPFLRRPTVTLSEIANEPHVVLTADEADRSVGAIWRKHHLKPNIVFRTASVEAVRSMVSTGAAVTILSDTVYRPWSIDGSRVEKKDVAGKIPTMDVGLAWLKTRPLSDAAVLFDEFLRAAA
jgi:DNA-binding transcriptional LysR family regulator